MDEIDNIVVDIPETETIDNAPIIDIETLANTQPRRITKVFKYKEEYDYSDHPQTN